MSPIFLILLLWSAGLGAAIQFAKVTVSFPVLQSLYEGSDAALGFMLSLISFLGVILGLIAGLLVASYGFRRILIWALFLGSALSAFQASLPGIDVFLGTRLIEGLSHLGIVVAAPTLMGVMTPQKWRNLAMTLWSAFFAVGYAITAAIGPGLIAAFGPNALFVAHALYMAVVGVAVILLLPAGTSERPRFPKMRDLLKRHWQAYRSPRQFAPGAGWLFYTCTFVSVMTVVPPLLSGFEQTVLVPLLPLAGIATSFTISTILLRYISAVQVVMLGFGSAALFAISGFVWPLSGWMLLGLFAAMGLIQSASFAMVPQLNSEATSQALANGVMSQMGNLGNLIGTPIMFALLTSLGTYSIYGMLLFCFGSAVAVHAWLAVRRSRSV